jgi:hypothetical protein
LKMIAVYAAGVVVWLALPAAAQSPEDPMLRQSLRFSDMTWRVKDSGGRKVGPGPNWFSAANVSVDAEGRLHLRATSRNGGCVAAEVVAVPSLGYGTYEFTVASNLDGLPKNLVFGLFVWDDTSSDSFHREMDVEIGRWGREDNADAQFVIQPYTVPQNIVRFHLTPGLRGSVHSFVWTPSKASFRSEGLDASGGRIVIQEHEFDSMIPDPDKEQARVNLWCMDSKAPAGGTSEVVLSGFRFKPLR